MVKDARGVDINVGDTVIYVTSGSSYTHREVAIVAKINGKTKVTLQDGDTIQGEYEKMRRERILRNRDLIKTYKDQGKQVPQWLLDFPTSFDEPILGSMVDGKSVFVVTGLPHMEGRLNK